MLYNNGVIFDGVSLFHKNHGNLIAKGGKPTQASIQAIILQMQHQRDQFGEAIYITPQHIMCLLAMSLSWRSFFTAPR